MKTSLKILLTIAGIAIGLFITSLLILRKDLASYLANKEGVIVFENIEVIEFKQVDFSGLWNIRLRQGQEYLLEIGQSPAINWEVKALGDQLVVSSDTGSQTLNYARVTVPRKVRLNLGKANDFIMEDMTLDSIWITFSNGGVYTGFANQAGYIEIKTEGKVTFKINK